MGWFKTQAELQQHILVASAKTIGICSQTETSSAYEQLWHIQADI